jgi:hypothetical protein
MASICGFSRFGRLLGYGSAQGGAGEELAGAAGVCCAPNFGTAATAPARHPTGSQRGPRRLERVSGIEPPSSAWKADILA